jgi:hypothetical protein
MQPGAFIVCPLSLRRSLSEADAAWQNALYQLAYERAQEQLRPSLPERDLLGVWN